MKSDKPFRVVAGLTMELARRYIALVKWRNQLLALLCLAVFAGLGVLYFQHWVVQKPFGIILIIGEGLAPERIALTRVNRKSTRLNSKSQSNLVCRLLLE